MKTIVILPNDIAPSKESFAVEIYNRHASILSSVELTPDYAAKYAAWSMVSKQAIYAIPDLVVEDRLKNDVIVSVSDSFVIGYSVESIGEEFTAYRVEIDLGEMSIANYEKTFKLTIQAKPLQSYQVTDVVNYMTHEHTHNVVGDDLETHRIGETNPITLVDVITLETRDYTLYYEDFETGVLEFFLPISDYGKVFSVNYLGAVYYS